MEEEDKKTETNLEIWKKHQEKEGKGLKKIFIFIFNRSNLISFALTLTINPKPRTMIPKSFFI